VTLRAPPSPEEMERLVECTSLVDDSASRTFRSERRADGVNSAAVSSTAMQMAPNENEKATQLTRYGKGWRCKEVLAAC
jgi:hypothetical protein